MKYAVFCTMTHKFLNNEVKSMLAFLYNLPQEHLFSNNLGEYFAAVNVNLPHQTPNTIRFKDLSVSPVLFDSYQEAKKTKILLEAYVGFSYTKYTVSKVNQNTLECLYKEDVA